MRNWVALLMLIPAIAMFCMVFAVPMVMAVRLSLLQSDYVTETFVGLKNFSDALRDKLFMKSFFNVAIFVLALAPITVWMTYGATSMLTRFSERAQSIGRFVSYIPNMVAGIIISLVWRWLLKRDGLINGMLLAAGMQSIPWLTQPWTARLSLILVSLSTGPGALVVMLSGAMKSIPVELHDQAMIDGANESQYRKLIVRPLMMPMLLLILLLIIVGTFQAWETIYVLTGEGGPKGSTATPVYQIFQTAFMENRPSLAAAKGLILLVILGLVVFIKQRIERWVGAER